MGRLVRICLLINFGCLVFIIGNELGLKVTDTGKISSLLTMGRLRRVGRSVEGIRIVSSFLTIGRLRIVGRLVRRIRVVSSLLTIGRLCRLVGGIRVTSLITDGAFVLSSEIGLGDLLR